MSLSPTDLLWKFPPGAPPSWQVNSLHRKYLFRGCQAHQSLPRGGGSLGGGREGFCSSPCKNDDIEGMLTAATCLGHLSPCDTTHFSRYSMQKQLRKKETGFYAFLSCLGAGFLCQVLLLWSARAHSWVPSTKWLSQDWGHNFCLALAATNRSQACQSKRVTRTGLRRPSPAPWHPLLWEFRGDKTPLPAAIHQGRAHYFRPNQAEGKNEHPPSMGLLNLWSDLISWRL